MQAAKAQLWPVLFLYDQGRKREVHQSLLLYMAMPGSFIATRSSLILTFYVL